MKKILSVLFVLMMVLSLAACGGKTAPAASGAASSAAASAPAASTPAGADGVVGAWAHDNYVYTFKADGTGTYDAAGTMMEFTYEATDKELSITFTGNTAPMVLEYSINGNVLTIVDSFGSDVNYTKK